MIRLENTSEGHNKFWEVEMFRDGQDWGLWRHYGRIGSAGAELRVRFHNRFSTEDELRRLVRQKFSRGYLLVRCPAAEPDERLHLTATEVSILRTMGVANLSDSPARESVLERQPIPERFTRVEEAETITAENLARIQQQNSQYRKKTNKKLTLRELLS